MKIFETIDELKPQFKKFLFKLFVLKMDYKSLLINYKLKILKRLITFYSKNLVYRKWH